MKATKAIIQARVEEVLAIRLDGAEMWHVREYVREKEQEDGSPWRLAEGQKPLSDPQLWRYLAKADKLIAESCRSSRKKLVRRHLAQRRNLYAKAVSQGDARAALACLRDEAELLGLYPAKGVVLNSPPTDRVADPLAQLRIASLANPQARAALAALADAMGGIDQAPQNASTNGHATNGVPK
jgi:hypothetical protein